MNATLRQANLLAMWDKNGGDVTTLSPCSAVRDADSWRGDMAIYRYMAVGAKIDGFNRVSCYLMPDNRTSDRFNQVLNDARLAIERDNDGIGGQVVV